MANEAKLVVSLRLEPVLLAKLEKLAQANRRTVSFVVREAVEQWLEWVEQEQGKSKPSA